MSVFIRMEDRDPDAQGECNVIMGAEISDISTNQETPMTAGKEAKGKAWNGFPP